MKKTGLVLTALAATALLMSTLYEATCGQEEERATCDPYLSEAERISGWCLRSPKFGNPGMSSSVDESALRLAEQIAGQPLRSAEVGNPGRSSSVDEGALRLAEQIAGQPLRLVGK